MDIITDKNICDLFNKLNIDNKLLNNLSDCDDENKIANNIIQNINKEFELHTEKTEFTMRVLVMHPNTLKSFIEFLIIYNNDQSSKSVYITYGTNRDHDDFHYEDSDNEEDNKLSNDQMIKKIKIKYSEMENILFYMTKHNIVHDFLIEIFFENIM